MKCVHWDHYTDAIVEPQLLTPFNGSFITTKTLAFFEANYKLTPSWSLYAQYADGIYVPDISAFDRSTPVLQYPAAETTTNYQTGTVFYATSSPSTPISTTSTSITTMYPKTVR